MSVGYLLLVHREPQLVLRLARAIRRDSRGPIVIHVDPRSRSAFEPHRGGFEAIPDVQTFSAHKTVWGGYGIVSALLDGARRILDNDPMVTAVRHLSGQDYPVRRLGAFETFVGEAAGQSFLSHRVIPYPVAPGARLGDDGTSRLDRLYVDVLRRRRRVPILRRRLPQGLTFYQGSSLWCLSRRHLAHYLEEAPAWDGFFRRSLIPDESFFQTILLNSRHAAEVISDDLLYANWSQGAPSPDVLALGDLPAVLSSKAYFARKMEWERSSGLLDALDAGPLA